MVFSYKESDLRDLNLGRNVYSVNPDYAKKLNAKVITASPEKKNETNVIKTEDGEKFKVLKTSPEDMSGYQGMAVAPIV